MKSFKSVFLPLTALLAVLGLENAQAAPPEIYKSTFKSLYGHATFFTSDPCSFTQVDVFGADEASRTNKDRTSHDVISLYVSTNNYCTSEYTSWSGLDENAVVSGSPQHVSLQATFTITQYPSGATGTVVMDLELTANREFTSNGTTQSHNTFPGGMSIYRWNGFNSTADVSGTLTVNGLNITDTFTLGYAEVGAAHNGFMSISRQ